MSSAAVGRRRCVAATERWGTVLVLGPCGREVARWPLEGRGAPDLATVDVLARLALAARRRRCSMRLVGAAPELLVLVDLVGLRLQVVGEAEGGEDAGVEEAVLPDDPVT